MSEAGRDRARIPLSTVAGERLSPRDESEYDTFGAGHASTSLSAALGMAIARDRKGEDHHVVALIGDASLAGGMAMEAINQAGHLKTRLIVVLNDNEMSIAPAVGALTGYLNRIRGAHGYHRFKDEVEEKLLAIPSVGERLHHAAKTMKDAIAAAVLPGALVNELGFKYIGYVDGHNPRALVAALREAKQIKDGPVIVHALTTKGKGFPQAEKDYYDGTRPGRSIWKPARPSSQRQSADLHAVFGDTLCELMEKDEKIVALTAAMPDGTGICTALEKFPERSFDVGIAEQHCVTFAAGMSCRRTETGLRDLFDVPAARFRSADPRRLYSESEREVLSGSRRHRRRRRTDASWPARHRLPARRAQHRRDGAEGRRRDARHDVHDDRARRARRRCVIRAATASACRSIASRKLLEIGKGEILRDGGEVAIVAYGSMVHPSLAGGRESGERRNRNDGRQRAVRQATRRSVAAGAGANQATDRHGRRSVSGRRLWLGRAGAARRERAAGQGSRGADGNSRIG